MGKTAHGIEGIDLFAEIFLIRKFRNSRKFLSGVREEVRAEEMPA